MRIFITGVAGFIGNAVARELGALGHEVLGIDNLNDYYSKALKQARLALLEPKIQFQELDFVDYEKMLALTTSFSPEVILHLGAQAGVRHSIENPFAYGHSNLSGHLSILELARNISGLTTLIYASSSSVYGGNSKIPFEENDPVDQPVSLYAATKRANELMSETYHHLYGIDQVGLRFFTVYGPWGRPDMAYWLFADKIMRDQPIPVFNGGDMMRDFTYIDDIVDAIVKICLSRTQAPVHSAHNIYNIGNNKPEKLSKMIAFLEENLGKKARINLLPMQPGDVKQTYADITKVQSDYHFEPSTSLEEGVKSFCHWFKEVGYKFSDSKQLS